jgi:hypothetical protein
VTAQSILVQAESAGLTLRPAGDNIGIKPVARLTPELKQAIAACKPEVLALLRAQRQEKISQAWAAAYGRLECQFSNGLNTSAGIAQPLVNAWNGAEANAEHVSAEYVAGKVQRADFEAALAAWEGAVTKAMECRAACDDCGARAVVLVTTDYGPKYCRRCLRPEPIGTQKGRRSHA